jgi:hypothetical protein
MRTARIGMTGFLLILPFLLFCAGPIAAQQHDVPSISAGAGGCRASFTVHDASKKPIYDAKIDVTVHYGFMNLRKIDLEVATNVDGKARVTGLPNFPKKPLEFVIRSGTVSKSVTDDPSNDCNAEFDVTLAVR